MTTQLLRGKRLRLTRLDSCNNVLPSATACAYTVTSGFITASMTPEYETGEEFVVKNANGDITSAPKDQDQLKRINLSIQLVGVDFSVVELLTGDALELDHAGDVVGVRTATGRINQRVAVELWTGVEGPDECEGDDPVFGYVLLGAATGFKMGDVAIENGPINVSLENGYTLDNARWGAGPWDVIDTDGTPTPGPLLVPLGANEHRLFRTTTIAPPAVTDGCQAMP